MAYDDGLRSSWDDDPDDGLVSSWDDGLVSSWDEPEPAPEAEDTGLIGGTIDALKGGALRTLGSLRNAFNVYTGDNEDVVDQSFQNSLIEKTSEQEAFARAIKERADVDDDGFIAGIKNVLGAAIEEPGGAMHEFAAQLPNTGVILSGMGGGAAIGGAIGGPVGALAGGVIGMFAGNTSVETGFLADERAQDGGFTDQERGDTIRQGAIKGGVITGVDAFTLGVSRAMMGVPGKAVERAITNKLFEAGVDTTSDVAVKAALKSSPKLVQEASRAGAQALAKTMTGAKRTARGLTAFGLETVGEGAGEYLGSKAAGLEASPTDAVMESLMSAAFSLSELHIAKKLTSPGLNTRAVNDANRVLASGSVDDAIAAASDAVKGAPRNAGAGLSLVDKDSGPLAGFDPLAEIGKTIPVEEGRVSGSEDGGWETIEPGPLPGIQLPLEGGWSDEIDPVARDIDAAWLQRAEEQASQSEEDYRAARAQQADQEIEAADRRYRQQEILDRYKADNAPPNPMMADALQAAGLRTSGAMDEIDAEIARLMAIDEGSAALPGRAREGSAATTANIDTNAPRGTTDSRSRPAPEIPFTITPRPETGTLETQEVPIDRIQLSKDVPQFKQGANKDTGVVEPLGGKYDRLGAGPVLVWERLNGDMELISGRHRWDLAKRSGEQTIPGQVVKESEGFTKAHALTADAELNIRDNQGEVSDYATYFKTAGIGEAEAEQRGLLSRAKGRAGHTIASQGSDLLYRYHQAGQITDQQAAAIAKAAPQNEGLQTLGIDQINNGASIDVAVGTMQAVQAMRGIESQAAETTDMFAFDDEGLKKAKSIAKRVAGIKKDIRDRINAVRGAANRPEKAKAMGVDVKDPEGIKKKLVELEAQSAELDSWPTNPTLRAQLVGEDAFEVQVTKQEAPAQEEPAEPVMQDDRTMSMFDDNPAPSNNVDDNQQAENDTQPTPALELTQETEEQRATREQAPQAATGPAVPGADTFTLSTGTGIAGEQLQPSTGAQADLLGGGFTTRGEAQQEPAKTKLSEGNIPVSESEPETKIRTVFQTHSARGHIDDLAGDANKAKRAEVMAAIKGVDSYPVQKSGTAAIRDALYEKLGIEPGQNHAKDQQVTEWIKTGKKPGAAVDGQRSDVAAAIEKHGLPEITKPITESSGPHKGKVSLHYGGVGSNYFNTADEAARDLKKWLDTNYQGVASKAQEIDAKANAAASSPQNDRPDPTPAQIAADNYKKGEPFTLHGQTIVIENPRDSMRGDKETGGKKWQNKMAAHYGDLKGTTGADGDAIDVFVGQNPESERIFVIDQQKKNGDKGGFDEHKIMLGFSDQVAAEKAYLDSYDKGWGIGPVSELTPDQFKDWIANGDHAKPFSSQSANEFITTPDGSIDFGEISAEQAKAIGRQAGKIRLSRGVHNSDGSGHGLAHIEEKHGKQIRAAGFTDAVDFVQSIASQFGEIWRAKVGQLLAVVRSDGEHNVMYVQLEPAEDGDYYRVNTAFPVRQDNYEVKRNFEPLWPRSEPETGTTGGRPKFADQTVNDSGSATPNANGQGGEGNTTPKSEIRQLTEAVKSLTDVMTGQQALPTVEPAQESGKIDNFGEKLGGSRADKEAARKARAVSEMDDAEIAASTLSKVWPKSDIDAIEDSFLAAFSYAARDEIPAKPRKGWKLARWVEQVKLMTGLAAQAQDYIARNDYASFIEIINKHRLSGFYNRVQLLQELDRKYWNQVGKVETYPDAYTYDADRNKIPMPQTMVLIDGKHRRFDGADWRAHIPAIKELLGEVESKGNRIAFEIRGREGNWNLYKKGDSEYRVVSGPFKEPKEARAFLNDSYDEVLASWEAIKARDNIGKADVRRAENKPRTGKDHRGGKNVTPEQFHETFGFRGTEFGHWVTQGDGAKERQGLLNQAYDALMDLADILKVPPKAMSLNGSMGIAFGSRGHGWASAHFEPGNLVINLTKTRGAGAVAHEFFHSLDNYFARQRGELPLVYSNTDWYITGQPEPMMVRKDGRSRMTRAQLDARQKMQPDTPYFAEEQWEVDPKHQQGVRPEVEKAFGKLVSALDASPMAKRAAKIDKGKADGYWSRVIERAARSFENYIISKMEDQGYQNDYLANVKSFAEWSGKDPERYPYLKPDEMPPIKEAFDNLFDTIDARETDVGVGLFRVQDEIDGQPLFKKSPMATSTRVSVADIEAVVNKVAGNWGVKPVVLQSENELPERTQRHIQRKGISGRVPGYYDRETQTFYLVADAMKDRRDAQKTLLHEGVGHLGLERVMGSEINDFLRSVYDARESDPVIAKAFEYVNRPTTYGNERPIVQAAEIVARIAESDPQHNIVQRFIQMVKQALRKMGFDVAFSSSDIIEALRRAKQALETGERGTGAGGGLFHVAAVDAETVMGQWRRKMKLLRASDDKNFTATVTAPLILRDLGLLNNLSITKRRLNEIMDDHKDIPKAVFDVLPLLLANPSVIYQRSDGTNNLVIEVRTQKGEPILVGIDADRIATVTPKHDSTVMTGKQRLLEEIGKSQIVYARNEKALTEARALVAPTREQSPQRRQDQGKKVRFLADIVKKYGRENENPGAMFRVTDQTDTPEFRAWFRDSKVVDESGQPLVVYHGTVADFDSFDNSKTGANDRGLWGRGHYFSAATESPNSYALRQGDGAQVIPAYVSIKNPLILKTGSDLVTRLPDGTDTRELIGSNLDGTKIKEIAVSGGHDGVIQIRPNGLIGDVVAFRPEQIKSAIGNTGTFDPTNPNILFRVAEDSREELNRRMREEHHGIWWKAKMTAKRYLAPGGLLPEKVFKDKIVRDSQMGAAEMDVQYHVAALERNFKLDFGIPFDKRTPDQARMMRDALAGNPSPDMPESTAVALEAMRQYIDRYSAAYVDVLRGDALRLLQGLDLDRQAAVRAAIEADDFSDLQGSEAQIIQKLSLMQTIAGNMGEYVHRSYRAFDDPVWARIVPDEVLNNARDYLESRYLENNPEATDAQASASADRVIESILKENTAFDSLESFIRESKLGAKDLSLLKRRKQIAPEIRALMGEHEDPRLNFAKSATKMTRLIFNDAFLKKVREHGMGVFLFEDGAQPAGHWKTIAGEGNEAYAPLNGLKTTPEINQAFVDALGNEHMEAWYKAIVQINGAVKFGKTVLSPTTAARNFMSAMFFTMGNGHFNLGHAAMSLRVHLKKEGENYNYLRHLKELGVVYDTPYAEEMMRLLRDTDMQDRLMTGNLKAKHALDMAQSFYRFGDDFWKVIGFENEVSIQMKHYGLDRSAAEKEAAERIRNTYPTYSMVGKFVTRLRRFPLAGTFVSFPAEIIRTSYHILKHAKQDMAHDKALGAQRLAGLAIISGLAYAAQALSMLLLGVDDDEDEAVRQQLPEWSRNSNLYYLSREDGNLRYLDLSFLDPYNYWKRPITAIMRDQPLGESAQQAAADMLKPFFGTDIVFGALTEIWANKKSSGGPVYNESDTAFEQSASIADHLRKAVQPGAFSNMERILKAVEGEKTTTGRTFTMQDEMMALAGFRVSTLDPAVSLKYRTYEAQDQLRGATSILNKVASDPNPVSDEDLRDAFDRVTDIRQETYGDLLKSITAAERSGLDRRGVISQLRAGGMSQDDARALAYGRIPRKVPTSQYMRSAITSAGATFGPEAQKEIARRRSLIIRWSAKSQRPESTARETARE